MTEDAFNRLHAAINESRKSSEFIKVRRDDLIELLYAWQSGKSPHIS